MDPLHIVAALCGALLVMLGYAVGSRRSITQTVTMIVDDEPDEDDDEGESWR